MHKGQEVPDYSLEMISAEAKKDFMKIKTTLVLEVQTTHLYCVKGDCAGDYPCWPICGAQQMLQKKGEFKMTTSPDYSLEEVSVDSGSELKTLHIEKTLCFDVLESGVRCMKGD